MARQFLPPILLALSFFLSSFLAPLPIAKAIEPLPELLLPFVESCRDPKSITASDVTNSLPGLAPPPSDERFTHAHVLSHYKRYFSALQKQFPDGTLSFSSGRILKGYEGAKTLNNIPSYFLPYMLFNAPLYSPDSIRFEKLEITHNHKTIYGLRMTTKLNPLFRHHSPNQIPVLLYIEDLNARIFGFTHAQVIAKLSQNVEPAAKFLYNDVIDWRNHKRYGKEDQFSRPIELTNYAHDIGNDYLVSDHPDFALHFLSYADQPVTVTFFLWRNDIFSSLFSRLATLPPRLPDFVFQLVLEKP